VNGKLHAPADLPSDGCWVRPIAGLEVSEKKIEQSRTPPGIRVPNHPAPIALPKYSVCCHIEHQFRLVFTDRTLPRVLKALPIKCTTNLRIITSSETNFSPRYTRILVLEFFRKKTPFLFVAFKLRVEGFISQSSSSLISTYC